MLLPTGLSGAGWKNLDVLWGRAVRFCHTYAFLWEYETKKIYKWMHYVFVFVEHTQRDEMRNLFVKLCKFETPVFLRLCFPRCSTFIRLRKIPKFYLISWCGNFVERYNFSRILGDSPETLSKLCLSTKFPHQVIRWNFGILRSTRFPWFTSFYRLINLG